MKNLCAAFLMAALMICTGCASPSVSDPSITAQVQSRLAADSDTSSLKLNVTTTGGVVTLSGSAATEIEKDKAEQIAKHTDGVTRVVNNITISQSQTSTPAPGEMAGREEKKTSTPPNR